jgi:hypothetical protein
LAGSEQPPAARSLPNQGPFIRRKDPLHLEPHLRCRARTGGLLHKDDLAATPDALLDSTHRAIAPTFLA